MTSTYNKAQRRTYRALKRLHREVLKHELRSDDAC
jgi:hypothetical protein